MKTTLKLLIILLFCVYNGNISAQGPSKVQQEYITKGTINEYLISKKEEEVTVPEGETSEEEIFDYGTALASTTVNSKRIPELAY